MVGRPVVLWEVIGPHRAVARASSGPDVGASPPSFDLDTILQRWSIPVAVGSRWVTAPGDSLESWVVAPVRSRAPAPPPAGRERRSRERIALELAGLALGLIGAPAPTAASTATDAAKHPEALLAHQVANPLTAARAALQLSMESIGRWVDLAADRRLSLLDDLGQVLEDLDRTAEMLRAMKENARAGALTARGERGGRFDAVRVVLLVSRSAAAAARPRHRSRVHGPRIDVPEGRFNALFDMLVSIVRTAADPSAGAPTAVRVQLEQKGNELELVVRGGPALADFTRVRAVTEEVFSGTVKVESHQGPGVTSLTIALPLPPQREADRRPV